MNAKKARRLLIGTIVMRNGDLDDLGTIRKFGPGSFYVDWANGQRGWIDYQDAKRIEVR